MECSKLIYVCLLLLLHTLQFSTYSTVLPSGSFPNTSEVNSAEENTWLNVTFSIRHSPNWTSLTLYKRFAPQCAFRKKDGTCSVGKSIILCICGSKEGEYLFTKRVDRSDNGSWTWKESINISEIANGTIMINISYPTIVTNLTVQGYTYKELDLYTVAVNSSAQVVCMWIKGNPPTAVHLKDENGTLVRGEPDAEILRHNISTNRCHRIVNIVCASVDTHGNNSVKILTECAPKLINDSISIRQSVQEQSVVLEFQTLFSRNIMQCRINHYKEESSSNPMIYGCYTTLENYSEHDFKKCRCNISGRIPYIRVTVHINNVTEDDNGIWLVNVSNSLGSVHFNFSLPVLKEISTSLHIMIQVGVSVGTGVLVFTFIIISIIVVKQTRKTKLQYNGGENECKMVINNIYAGSNTLNRMLMTPYKDIVDSEKGETMISD